MQILAKLVALLLVGLCFPMAARAEDNDCVYNWIAPGQLTVTPARITGSSQEHLLLHVQHPQNHTLRTKDLPESDGYLITGDKVDLITSCEDYDYVRFHGTNRVSVGWVDKSRIDMTGNSYVPLPPNSAAFCRASEADLDTHFGQSILVSYPPMHVNDATLARIHVDSDFESVGDLTRVTVDGREMVAVAIRAKATCSSQEINMWKDDLSAPLTPRDSDARNPMNGGGNGPLDGTRQLLVKVAGQPVIQSFNRGGEPAYLSTIDKNGDLVATCKIDSVPVEQPIEMTDSEAKVCAAVLDGKAERISMHKPGPDQTVEPVGKDGEKLELFQGTYVGGGGENKYSLKETGNADLDNSGHVRTVGIVHFEESDSRGCGSSFTQALPAFLDDSGNADLHDPRNQKLFGVLPKNMEKAWLVYFDGQTYVAMAPPNDDRVQEVWKLDHQGARKVCSYQLRRWKVSPISDESH